MAPNSPNPEDRDRTRSELADSERESSDSPSKNETSIEDEMVIQTDGMSDSQKTASDPQDVPAEFGRYRIEKELGRGGMGAVYLAHDSQLDRKVAIKIPFFTSDDEGGVERFRREARAMATLQHANLCPVFDVGQFQQWHFLTMAFIDGQSLSAKLKTSGLQVSQSVQLLKKVALALQVAHDSGIVHRDLKPANIMLNQQMEPIIMDFGLARRQSAVEIELTKPRTVLGSPSYMAPEQIEARHDEVGPFPRRHAPTGP